MKATVIHSSDSLVIKDTVLELRVKYEKWRHKPLCFYRISSGWILIY